jgi:hypothetical protein
MSNGYQAAALVLVYLPSFFSVRLIRPHSTSSSGPTNGLPACPGERYPKSAPRMPTTLRKMMIPTMTMAIKRKIRNQKQPL